MPTVNYGVHFADTLVALAGGSDETRQIICFGIRIIAVGCDVECVIDDSKDRSAFIFRSKWCNEDTTTIGNHSSSDAASHLKLCPSFFVGNSCSLIFFWGLRYG